jgi:hypothetical protein
MAQKNRKNKKAKAMLRFDSSVKPKRDLAEKWLEQHDPKYDQNRTWTG